MYQRFHHRYKMPRLNSIMAKMCWYCGDPADTVDHVPPLSCVGDERERHWLLPACRECNCALSPCGSNEPGYRCLFIWERYSHKYRKFLGALNWTADDYKEAALDDRLEDYVRDWDMQAKRAKRRVAFAMAASHINPELAETAA